MADYEVHEYLKIKNTCGKAGLAIQMLMQYIGNMRCGLLFPEISISEIRLCKNGRPVIAGKTASKEYAPDSNDIYSDSVFTPEFCSLDTLAGADDEIEFKAVYTCDVNASARIGYTYWMRLFDACDCAELRKAVTCKSMVIRRCRADRNTVYGLGGRRDSLLFIYNEEVCGFCVPEKQSPRAEIIAREDYGNPALSHPAEYSSRGVIRAKSA